MRWAALAVIAGGCNQLFDLQSTKLTDAAEVAIDAPRVCPPVGTPLHVGRELQQVVRQDCTGYTPSRVTGTALASCLQTMPTYAYYAAEGSIDSEMQAFDIGLTYVDTVRLFPEGDRMFARGYGLVGQTASVYERSADNLWLQTTEPLPVNSTSYSIGTFTTGPDRRVVLTTGSSVEEHAQGSDGMWTLAKSYVIADCTAIYGVSLSPDGLRMLVTCYRSDTSKTDTRYAERISRSDEFGLLQTFDGAPQGVTMMVLSDDCSRVYFSALQSVFAAELD